MRDHDVVCVLQMSRVVTPPLAQEEVAPDCRGGHLTFFAMWPSKPSQKETIMPMYAVDGNLHSLYRSRYGKLPRRRLHNLLASQPEFAAKEDLTVPGGQFDINWLPPSRYTQ